MMSWVVRAYVACMLLLAASATSFQLLATGSPGATRLVYLEHEQGIDPYYVTYIVTDEYIRIDDASDSSGYILFNVSENKIYSVSHFNQSIFIIQQYENEQKKPDYTVNVNYAAIPDAPAISGKPVYAYRVTASNNKEENSVCMDIQLVPGLLPEVSQTLQKFLSLMSGQHVSNLDNTPVEYQTPCYLEDQIYNTGEYYKKGLPIKEWHSNEKTRQLVNFETVDIDLTLFTYPVDYQQYPLK